MVNFVGFNTNDNHKMVTDAHAKKKTVELITNLLLLDLCLKVEIHDVTLFLLVMPITNFKIEELTTAAETTRSNTSNSV